MGWNGPSDYGTRSKWAIRRKKYSENDIILYNSRLKSKVNTDDAPSITC